MRIRLIPALLFSATVMFGVKVNDAVHNGRHLSGWLGVSNVAAETEEAPKEEPEADAHEAPPAAAEGEAHGESAAQPPAEDEAGGPGSVSETRPESVLDKEFSPAEVSVLQSLVQRREQLDQWEKEIALRESVLKATELRLEKKMQDMDVIRAEVEKLLAEYKSYDDTKIKGLVKIYESMKPKDAARIFDEMEIPLLVEVIDKMSERKVAAVLSGMNPDKARQVTTELAAFRRLQVPAETASALPPPAAPAPTQTATAPETPKEAAPEASSPPAAAEPPAPASEEKPSQ